MLIRTATLDDREELCRLWKECFPGEDDFTALMFSDSIFNPEETRVLESGGEIVSMLRVQRHDLICEAQHFSAVYIFGVGTRRVHRGRGYARRLILDTTAISDAALVLIVPQTPSLFSLYAGMGFETAFYTETFMSPSLSEARAAAGTDIFIRELAPSECVCCDSLYRSASRMRFAPVRPEWKWADIAMVASVSGGGVLACFEGDEVAGYAVCEDGVISELICRGDKVYNGLAAACLERMGRETAPVRGPACPKKAEPFGMVRLGDAARLLSEAGLPDIDISVCDADVAKNCGKFSIKDGTAARTGECRTAFLTAADVVKTILSGGLPPYMNLVYN